MSVRGEEDLAKTDKLSPNHVNLPQNLLIYNVFPPSMTCQWPLPHLSQLNRLILCRNQIVSVPDEMSGLTQLEELTLDRNEILEFPGPIADMLNLRRLSLAHNRITSLPMNIRRLRRLSHLFLDHNPEFCLPETPEINFDDGNWNMCFQNVFDLPLLSQLGVTGCPMVVMRTPAYGLGTSVYFQQPEDLEAELLGMLKDRAHRVQAQ